MLYEQNYLAHFGVKGQRWGVRRFQNEDGSLTSAGKERYSKGNQDTGDSSDRSTSQDKRAYIGSEPKTKLFVKEAFDKNFKRERKAWEIRKTIASKNLHERISKDDSRKLAKFKKNVADKVINKMKNDSTLDFKTALRKARVENFVTRLAISTAAYYALGWVSRKVVMKFLNNRLAKRFKEEAVRRNQSDSIRPDDYEVR